MSFFEISHQDPHSHARAGVIQTDHGRIETPIFMPVGTQGTVKAVHFQELAQDIEAQIILANTYHLYLRPGMEVLRLAGGIHRFNGWNGPVLTDSGGYQVYSLAKMRKIDQDSVTFRAHIDGRKLRFTPEYVMDIQRIIGADIIMAFDECTPYPCDYDYAKRSMRLTHNWLKRCIDRFKDSPELYGYTQFLFPIVQGSVYPDLRKESATFISEQNQVGNAIGGLAVGEPASEMYHMIEQVNAILPKEKPRYLMGVGTPENILEAIERGVDMFDCVMPTRNARHGYLFTHSGIIQIKNLKWEKDFSPIDELSDLPLLRNHTKAYLRHLFKANEILAMQIASINNLSFYLNLVTNARKAIIEGRFSTFKTDTLARILRKC
ncbi:MAG: tRNA guanosine(34) transglycosylase Tgt [Chitinophagales bacterium]|jgi:queuine tRNA-ribosyltransferase|nr:tRNA guanosine(34) transglycosylase Tgt [Chitinophagales bacterium]